MRLMIITPIFPPAIGGAASYYKLLSEWLLSNRYAEEISIISEKMPGVKHRECLRGGKLKITRIFPYRAGAELSKSRQYLRYLIQNIQYVGLPDLIRKMAPDILLIHSGFHNYLNLLKFVVPRIKDQCRCIADVRDHLLPEKSLGQLKSYDNIIACSENILQYLAKTENLMDRVSYIRVMQEPISRLRINAQKTLSKYALSKRNYFLYAGLIKAGKGVDLLLQTYQSLRLKGIDTQMVLAGLIKDQKMAAQADKIPGAHLLGSISRDELLDLMSKSILNINLSPSEGMPRVCLEALALGSKVLLPQGIPEFNRFCPDAVSCSSKPDELAEQIIRLVKTEQIQSFPIDEYNIDNVMKEYVSLFRGNAGFTKKRHKNRSLSGNK